MDVALLGSIGGKKSASRLSKKQRIERASNAANARWEKYRAAKRKQSGATK